MTPVLLMNIPMKLGNYKEAKFQFVLNMRENMPKDKPLSLKVLLHEQGKIPDVLELILRPKKSMLKRT